MTSSTSDTQRRIPELLAPAGNATMLHAAIDAGADAVYLGMGSFNARRNADNFDDEGFARACDYAHLRGARVYVAMNTIVLPHEMRDAMDCARKCAVSGADAFIVQDLGLLANMRRLLPEVAVHASTQMSIHSADGVEACAQLGVERITLARELSLDEIARLCEKASASGVQIEVFAHGALCICYSGQCLMSSMIGGRSANRGLCAQACRLPYSLRTERDRGKDLDVPGEHLLSPKDLCTIDEVGRLAEAGVSSLKIEGRMKSPEYVHTAVEVYRSALDALCEGPASEDHASEGALSGNPPFDSAEGRERLASVFTRGFTTAYIDGIRDNEMMSYQRPNNRGQFIGRVKSVHDGVVSISCELPLEDGDIIDVWTSRTNVAAAIQGNVMRNRKTAEVPLADFGNGEEPRGSNPKGARRGGNPASIRQNDRVFRVRSAREAFADSDIAPKVPVVGSIRLRIGEPLSISFALDESSAADGVPSLIAQRILSDAGGAVPEATFEGAVVEEARTKAVTPEEVLQHVGRLGQSPFALSRLDIELDEGVGIGFSALHKARTEALGMLEEAVLAPFRQRSSRISENAGRYEQPSLKKTVSPAVPLEDVKIAVLATNPDCARAAKRAGASAVYVPAYSYKRGQSAMCGRLVPEAGQTTYPNNTVIAVPSVLHDAEGASREAAMGLDAWEHVSEGDAVLVEGLGQLLHAAEIGAHPQVGPVLPMANASAVDVAAAFGVDTVWLSPELTCRQISELASPWRIAHPDDSNMLFGAKVAGAQELMVTEHCVLMSEGPCNQDCASCRRRTVETFLHDRKGYDFPVVTDQAGRSHIYNSVALDGAPFVGELAEAGIGILMVDATLMDPEQTAQAVGRVSKALSLAAEGAEPLVKQSGTTSGHFHRGVM